MYEEILKRKKLIPDKLSSFGFKKQDEKWLYMTKIMDGEFTLYVYVSITGEIETDLLETEIGEHYVLYKTKAVGTYVGSVRTAIEEIIIKITDVCYETVVFKSRQSQMVIEYVRQVYGDELEFLWKKFDDNAIWRRKDNKKWYAAMLTVPRSKLGLDSEEIAEIIDLRLQPELMEETIRKEHYYPGWHMNKKYWYTIILDGSVGDEEICERIRVSYELAKKR